MNQGNSSAGVNAIELEKHVRKGAATMVSGDNLDISFAARVLGVHGDTLTIANTVPFDLISRFANSKNFTLLVELLRIRSDKVTSDGKNMIFRAETVDSVGDTRSDERFTFASDENVRCEFTNPADNETQLSKQVLDMSASGFSLKTFPGSTLFQPGTEIPGMRILIGNKLYSTRNAVSVYQRKFMDEDGKMYQQAGFKFLTENGTAAGHERPVR